jgi:response regulator RpfG family c-di-GMP phosphodiesterase
VVEVRRRTVDIRRREEEIALRLVSAAESRDGDMGAHVRRIGLYSAAIARVLGWSEPMIDDLRMAAPMHDIGKLGIPDSILLARGALTEDQWSLLRTHTTIGARVLEGSDVPLLQMARQIALCHHEWWDGTGYPEGRSGTDIPEAARIVAVADVYDALVTKRPYKAALPEDEALAVMASERGTHFDPEIYDAFLRALPRIRELSRSVGASDLAPVL